MRRYLDNLREKPHKEKKRFALLLSLSVTVFIFSAWSLAHFGAGGLRSDSPEPERAVREVGPLEGFYANLNSSLGLLSAGFTEVREGVGSWQRELGQIFNPPTPEPVWPENVLTEPQSPAPESPAI